MELPLLFKKIQIKHQTLIHIVLLQILSESITQIILYHHLLNHHPAVKSLLGVSCDGQQVLAVYQRRNVLAISKSPTSPWLFSSELTGCPFFVFVLFCFPFKLSEILKFGLDKLLSSEGSTVDEVDLGSILGETKDGQWVPDALPAAAEGGNREQEEGSELGTRSYFLCDPF